MLSQRRWIIALTIGICMSAASLAEAQVRMPFKSRQQQQQQPAQDEMALTQAHGPWLIMCASFSGEQGMQDAKALVTELRNNRVNAYIYTKRFDHSKKLQGSGWQAPENEVGKPLYKPWHGASDVAYDQVAVVVGNFSDLNDPNAAKYLKALREFPAKSMSQNAYVGSSQVIEQRARALAKGSPLAAAFLMPNPLLPSDFFKARQDKETQETVWKMNKNVKYSLLKCKKPYSVRVATFSGKTKFNATASQIQQVKNELADRIRNNQPMTEEDSPMGKAVYHANVLCRALRKSGVEAYEYHDMNESYVCVGGFNSPTADGSATTAESGRQEMNPAMAAVINRYKANTQKTINGPIVKVKTLKALDQFDIRFDPQPMPIKVPRFKKRGLGGLFGR